MAKKIELLHTTYDESGNIESQEVVHPLTSPDCIIMENGKTLDEVMGDGIATPTLTHEGTSFKVGVGDSNIEVVDGDVAGMTLKGQSYQNILPKPTTLIMETDEKEFKINDKIDSNIIIDDNIAEIATVKGKTIVNTIQEESGSEYTVLGENLSGQSIVTTNKSEGNIKGITLQGQTLVNAIQEPCKDDYVVLGADDGIEISAETGGHGTIEDTVQGGINGAVLEGMTLVNIANKRLQNKENTATNESTSKNYGLLLDGIGYEIAYPLIANKEYLIIEEWNIKSSNDIFHTAQPKIIYEDDTVSYLSSDGNLTTLGVHKLARKFIPEKNVKNFYFGLTNKAGNTVSLALNYAMIIEYQQGMENWDISYFEGMKSVQMPVLKTTGKNLISYTNDNKMVNINQNPSDIIYENGGFKFNVSDSTWKSVWYDLNLKPNTTYTITYTTNFIGCFVFKSEVDTYVTTEMLDSRGQYSNSEDSFVSPKLTFTTDSRGFVRIRFTNSMTNGHNIIKDIQLEESSSATSYEPYQSSTVTTGKLPLTSDMIEQGSFYDSFELNTQTYEYIKIPSTNTDFYANRIRSKATFKVHGGDKYIFNLNTDYTITLGFCKNGLYSAKNGSWITNGTTITVPSDCDEMFFAIRKTSYANIVPSEFSSVGLEIRHLVNLRKVGDVQDELDLQTGKLTQRIGEIVLDGSEDWSVWSGTQNLENISTFLLKNVVLNSSNAIINSVADKFVTYRNASILNTILGEGLALNSSHIFIRIAKTKLSTDDVDGFKTWLLNNNIGIQYELETPIIKTIDLQVTDQDNNTIPHIQTQPTVTHITASSDHLIPTVTIDNNLSYDTIIKPSTLYTVRFKHNTANADNPLTVDLGGTVQAITSTEFTITTPGELTHNQLVFSGKNNVVSEVQVIEGDVTNIEYPFFEGMSDVKFSDSQFVSRGRNLAKMEKGYINSTNGLDDNDSSIAIRSNYIPINPNHKYRIYPLDSNASSFVAFYDKNKTFISRTSGAKRKDMSVIPSTTPSNARYIRFTNYGDSIDFSIEYMCEKGDVTSYVPYQPIITVEQDIDSILLTSDMFEQNGFNLDNYNAVGFTMQQLSLWITPKRIKSKTMIKVKPNTKYIYNDSVIGYALFFDKNGLYVGRDNTYNSITTTHDTQYVAMCLQSPQDLTTDTEISPSDLDSLNLILQEVPQEIVLRGIGDVKDELDLTRGEYIQRIGEAVFDGSSDENWVIVTSTTSVNEETTLIGIYGLNDAKPENTTDTTAVANNMVTNNYVIKNIFGARHTTEGCTLHIDNSLNRGHLMVRTKMLLTNAQQWEDYLQTNPLVVQYELKTPIIHKVNLTNTKVIQSYATETHYETITPSDSLIPNITIPSTLNYDVAIKPSTEYTIRANTSDNLTVDLGGATGTLSNGKVTLITPATLTHNEVKFSGTGKVKELMVVEGNEIKDNVPFFNGMKDVQMGGIKLVNIARYKYHANGVSINTNKTTITFDDDGGVGTASWGVCQFYDELLKPNTMYTIFMNVTKNTSTNEVPVKIQLGNASERFTNINRGFTGKFKEKIVTSNDISERTLALFFRRGQAGEQVVIENPMIIEGDWTHLDEIPFIESEMIIDQPIIRSQGKNLFDINHTKISLSSSLTMSVFGNGLTITSEGYTPGGWELAAFDVYDLFKKLQGHTVVLSCTQSSDIPDAGLGIQVFINNIHMGNQNQSFTIPTEISNAQLKCLLDGTTRGLGGSTTYSNIQLELGNTATSYEPYKHQTLYSNRVIGYEEGVHYGGITGIKSFNPSFNSVMADVEGLSIAYVTNGSSNFSFWDKDMVFISGKSYLDTSLSTDNKNGFIQVPSNAKYMKFASANTIGYATYYTKATVTGELPLRSLPSGVCDTLNLVTGEYVQNIKEVVIDGSEDWFIQEDNTRTEKTIYCRCISFPDNLPLPSDWDNNAYNVNLNCDNLTVYSSDYMWRNEVEGISRVQSSRHLRIRLNKNKLDTPDLVGFKQYLQQNPVTVQYELETPIVRKLGFTTKGNYSQANLATDCEWGASPTMHNNTFTTRYRTKSASSLPIVYNTHLFSNDFPIRYFNVDAHQDYEYISNIEYGQYVNVRRDKLEADTPEAFSKWLQHNPIEVGYITWEQSSESYSNIHKPIFFNNVNVQYLPNNVDIQPELTYQVRTRNSYVMDMMKPNTTYTMKCLAYSNSAKLYVANSSANTSVSSNKTLQFAQSHLDGSKNELVLVGQWYEPMVIEGDVTGKNLPYFKGILSSYHDVDEIEVYSVNKNLFDMSKVKPYEGRATYWWNTIVKENEVVSVRIGDINNGQFGAYIKLDVRPNSVYTLYIEMEKDGEPFDGQIYGYENDDLWGNGTFTCYANTPYHISTSHNAKYITIGFNYGKDFPIGTKLVAKNMRLYLGEESPVYIPHAHSTTLIEMPTRLETVKVVRPVMEKGGIENNGQNSSTYLDGVRTRDLIPVKPNMLVSVFNNGENQMANWWLYDANKNCIEKIQHDNSFDSSTLTIPENTYFVRIHRTQSNIDNLILTLKEYKPIQLNSLPNGVYDEIIMKPNSNKAQLVQRVGKVVLDGVYYPLTAPAGEVKGDDISCTYSILNNVAGGICQSDKLLNVSYSQDYKNIECIMLGTNTIITSILKTRAYNAGEYAKENPITVYYELTTPIIHEIQLKGYPHVYENGTVTLNTDTPHQTLVSYNVNQEQLINTQNETIIRHDQQIDDLYYYIEMYLEEIYQMELFRMKLELSL